GRRPRRPRPADLESVARWVEVRTGAASATRALMRKVFPDHWSFLLGEIALFCFVILVATGTFLTFFYVPSDAPTTYAGGYTPLQGAQVSVAYASVLRISFEVEAGLLMRQIHHWTAVVFVAVIVLHLSRVFFTGAFRRPREVNWLVGFVLLVLALAEGFTGYSLPDDLLSGTGARIAYSAALSIPVVGPWISFLVFGGAFPGPATISRFFVFHVMMLPGLFFALIGLHLVLIVLQKHTQYRGPRAREDNVVGRSFWPPQVFVSGGLFFLTAAVLALVGGLVQINPIWAYGPFRPADVSSPAQPDWYVGWLDGSLRIFPPFEPTILGFTLPAPFIPGVLIPGAIFALVAAWPFIEARLTHEDRSEHNLLQMPWEAPFRSATGAALVAYFVVLTLAGGNDVLSVFVSVRLETLTAIFRIAAIAAPVLTWIVVFIVLREIDRRRRLRPERAPEQAMTPSGRPGFALRRTVSGGFEEVE
ncbi:MAG TPA: ubiquinol-cytochrome c reductase cytochrome b subunit, partial [Candidatus Dormibacteraeota bacterium]|nr:ubiquinol-cytochrome c reductase cytochrome b subunit [Candidatus Dormibacteraeota bacterium]